jgi:hypothetical protein
MDEVEEGPVHSLVVHGTGFFSRGECTGCEWTTKGHPDDIRARWDGYHPNGGAQIIDLPRRVEIPPAAEDPKVQRIEQLIIVALTQRTDFGHGHALLVAVGLAQARCVLLGISLDQAPAYISVMGARIAHLSRRQREKLRHPSRNREEQQRILNGEVL